MSLPNVGIFYNKNEEIDRQHVNCGWFLNSDSMITVFKELEYPSEWDEVYLYGSIYIKEEVEMILELDEKLNAFWKEKFKNWNTPKPKLEKSEDE